MDAVACDLLFMLTRAILMTSSTLRQAVEAGKVTPSTESTSLLVGNDGGIGGGDAGLKKEWEAVHVGKDDVPQHPTKRCPFTNYLMPSELRPVEIPPLATDNLLENTDGVLQPPISVLSGRHPATFYIYADARYIDAFIGSKAHRLHHVRAVLHAVGVGGSNPGGSAQQYFNTIRSVEAHHLSCYIL